MGSSQTARTEMLPSDFPEQRTSSRAEKSSQIGAKNDKFRRKKKKTLLDQYNQRHYQNHQEEVSRYTRSDRKATGDLHPRWIMPALLNDFHRQGQNVGSR